MGDPAEMNFLSNPDELKSALLEQALKVLKHTILMLTGQEIFFLAPTRARYGVVSKYSPVDTHLLLT